MLVLKYYWNCVSEKFGGSARMISDLAPQKRLLSVRFVTILTATIR